MKSLCHLKGVVSEVGTSSNSQCNNKKMQCYIIDVLSHGYALIYIASYQVGKFRKVLKPPFRLLCYSLFGVPNLCKSKCVGPKMFCMQSHKTLSYHSKIPRSAPAFLHFVAVQDLCCDWLSDSELFTFIFLHPVAMQDLCYNRLKWPLGENEPSLPSFCPVRSQ